MLVVPLQLAERLADYLLRRCAASLAAEAEVLGGGRRSDRGALGMVSRLAGGRSPFGMGELLCSAMQSEVRRTRECARASLLYWAEGYRLYRLAPKSSAKLISPAGDQLPSGWHRKLLRRRARAATDFVDDGGAIDPGASNVDARSGGLAGAGQGLDPRIRVAQGVLQEQVRPSRT